MDNSSFIGISTARLSFIYISAIAVIIFRHSAGGDTTCYSVSLLLIRLD